ncbi:outer membrane lipoprotein-sorting protein [Sulfurovum sp. bin170]|uniref:outer membrane lipoprotein-sorting protein n=1 Tax=Sulfurovum sp. bin170 TaxID=2695268 RepID=UPI0013DF266B|nr:outer membrane lipoprotein-sorting protein [Sulfurovum sp. bin170]NEW60998.1 outer membrane lipoprotein-sorting protein [Sulfurovum sp. bin170]
MLKFLILFITTITLLLSNEAEEIIKKLDQNMRGESIYMKMSMEVKSMGHKRTIELENWSRGNEKSFVKITYPPKERGITFLSLDNQMWQYVPKIERVIKIPPSMMLQNWMGSDITNDDMVKQNSIIEDYAARILEKNGTKVTIELIPKDDAAVIWGKIITHIDTTTYTSSKDIFYDEEGEEVRVFLYHDIKKYGKYYIPTHWELRPTDKKDNYTKIELKEVKYDTEIPDKYFKKSALKRFSR